MPRSIWKGVMSFGMVAIPVRLYLATESSSKVSFNLLCPEHRSRIKNKRYCVEGDHEVAWGDVVRGYEYEKGNYVELTDEDLEKLPSVRARPSTSPGSSRMTSFRAPSITSRRTTSSPRS